MSNPTCETCRWWYREGDEFDEVDGQCRRYPPQLVGYVPGIGYSGEHILHPLYGEDFSQFPFVTSDMFCGEHQPRVEDKS